MADQITLEFNNIMSSVKNEVQEILHDNIEQFKKCVSDEVHRSVYPAYPTPNDYERRMDNGGLSDTSNYDVIEGDMSLTLANNTKSGTKYWKYTYTIPITNVVEEGSGDGWDIAGVPERPFMEKALEKFAYDVLEPQINALGGGK